ncbi:MAG: DUF1501 domain-containing protein [Asticcacaulis sp.]|nr:DUF1501 domain-containing protein [Asticcacaulis sp.]
MISNLGFKDRDRRQFLRQCAALGGMGAVAPFALQLAAAGSLAAASAPDYKALVCIFMFGGNDANNMVMPTDQDSYNRYWAARIQGLDPIALMPVGTAPVGLGQVSPITHRTVTSRAQPEFWGGMLPIVPKTPNPVPVGTNASERTFALHPSMRSAQTLFNAGRLAVLANVGTLLQPTRRVDYENNRNLPANLFSHNDQQTMWQAGATEGANIGWGGRLADMIVSNNGANALFTAPSTSGNTVFLSGQSTIQYPLNVYGNPAQRIDGTTGWLYGGSGPSKELRLVIRDGASGDYFHNDHAAIVARSMSAADIINGAYQKPAAAGILPPPDFINPFTGDGEGSYLFAQLHTVARMVAAGPALGLKRQVFFVSMGGFDTHDGQNDAQPQLMAELAQGLLYFDNALKNVGGIDMRKAVTAFTASDFSRTYQSNGDGSDHAWSGHHFIYGGAVKGGDMYGQFPTVGIDAPGFRNPDIVDNAMIPTTSVEQYGATLGRWFGVSDSDLNEIFPHLGNFSTPYLGFI